jgi:cytochrome P450
MWITSFQSPFKNLATLIGLQQTTLMSSQTLQALAALSLSWVVWRLLKSRGGKSDLDNVPGPEPSSFWLGHFPQIFNPNAWRFQTDIVERFGRLIVVRGPFNGKHLFVSDPRALHSILVKDQHAYEETNAFITANTLMFGSSLVTALGENHRRQKKLLTPVFAVTHLRNMMDMLYDVAHKIDAVVEPKVKNGAAEIDFFHWMTRASLEMIGQSGLGFSFDPLVEGQPEHIFSLAVRDLIPTLFTMTFVRAFLLPILVKIGPPRFRRFVCDYMLPWKNARRLRDIINTMHKTTTQIYNEKKKALLAGDEAFSRQFARGKDIISILMKANLHAAEEDRLSDEVVIGQMTTLSFAAMDTSATSLSRILYLLATHPEAQDRLRAEVTEARQRYGDVGHDELVELPFLDAVCRETMRLFPPLTTLPRVSKKDMVMPVHFPIKGVDGREMKEIFVPEDTTIFISINAANRDPGLWGEDAAEWKPQRWLEPLPESLTEARVPGVYSHILTFLGGVRSCIGFKFAQLEMKVMVSLLVEKYKFTPGKQEIDWEMNDITTPIIKNKPGFSTMPLKVALVNP